MLPLVAGVGNALLAVPLVRRLLEAGPGVRVVVLAGNAAIGEVMRRLEHFSPGRITVHVVARGWRGRWQMVRLARKARADVYLVPFPSNRWQYNLLAATSGARRRVLHGYPIGRLRTLAFLPATRVAAVRGLHDVEQNLRLADAMGLPRAAGPVEGPVFLLTADDRQRAAELLAGAGVLPEDRVIVIHAGGARTVVGAAKRWPPRLYAELIGRLLGGAGKVLLIEGPDEIGVADEILAGGDDLRSRVAVLRLAGELGDAAGVLARAALYVGSDSGLAHLAAAVGTRAVTIFAPADPGRVSPWGNRDLVVQVNKACSPCLRYPWSQVYPQVRCGAIPCVTEIGVEQVLATVLRALDARAVATVASGGGR